MFVLADSFNLNIFSVFHFPLYKNRTLPVLVIFICNGKLYKHITISIVYESKHSIFVEWIKMFTTNFVCIFENYTLKIDTVHALIFIFLGTVVLAETWESKLFLPQMKTAILTWLYMLVFQFWIHVPDILLLNNIFSFFEKQHDIVV